MDKRDDNIQITCGCAKEILHWSNDEDNTFEGVRKTNGVWELFWLDWIEIDKFLMEAETIQVTSSLPLLWLGYAIEVIMEEQEHIFMKHDETALKKFYIEHNKFGKLIDYGGE